MLLDSQSSIKILQKYKIPMPQQKLCKDAQGAVDFAKKNGFPVVLKIASDKLLHKTDAQAVKLNISQETFHQAYQELNNIKIQKEGIIVQKHVHGQYLLIGLKKDPTFGHVLAAGMGGIYTEILKDVSFRVTPVEKKDIQEMLQELQGYPLLKGYRGEKINLKLIQECLLKISKLAEKHPNIEELDINPLIVNEKEAFIVDARIVFN